MPLSSGIKYGAEGAAIGTSFAPGIGTAIGGAIGFIGGLFGGGDDVEEIRERRFRDFLGVLRREKKTSIEREAKRQSGLTQRASAGAARRALATGDVGSKEAYILPAQAEMTRVGTQALSSMEERYSQAEISAQKEYAGRPIEPGTMDYLMEAGKTAGEFFNMKRYIDALSKNAPATTETSTGGNITPMSGGSVETPGVQDQPYNEYQDYLNQYFDLGKEG